MSALSSHFDLECQRCSGSGEILICSSGQNDWNFVTVGFVGLAVDRHRPERSVLRCNGCRSERVSVRPRS